VVLILEAVNHRADVRRAAHDRHNPLSLQE